MRRLTICFLLIALGGCAAQTPTSGSPAPASPGQLAERPTVTPGSATPTPPAGAAEVSIVYESPQEGALRAVTTGGVLRELAEETGNFHPVPWSPSPDGRSVAVVVLAGKTPKGGFERATLWTAGIDESNPTPLLDLTHPDAGQLDAVQAASLGTAMSNPSYQRLPWTPDGKEIIVVSAHEGQVDLYAVPVAGGAPRRLTNTPALEIEVRLAPSGARMMYASTSSFGTGAGWADAAAWVQGLDGSAAAPLAAPAEVGGFIQLAGWIDDETAIALQHTGGGGGTTVWARQGDADTRQLYASPNGGFRWDLRPGQFAFIAAKAPDADGVISGNTWVWDGVAPEMTELPNGAATQVRLSPDLNVMLLCEDNANGPPYRSIWRSGERVQFAVGDCNGAVEWADDGTLAIDSGRDSGGSGLIIRPDGSVHEHTLQYGTAIAGWLGTDLYFFYLNKNDEKTWHLYRLNAAGRDAPVPVGPPLDFVPNAPRIVITR